MILPGLAGNLSFAQQTNLKYSQIWFDVMLQQTFNNHFRFLFHTNYKHLMDDNKWNQFMVRPTLIYTMNDYVYFQGGVQLLYTDLGDLNKLEVRPWQGINIFFPTLGRLHFNNFFRLEERFFYQNIGERQTTSLRGRYAILTNVPLNHPSMSPRTVYLLPNFELLGSLWGKDVERFIASTRYSLGAGYQVDDRVRLETIYLLERSRDRAEDNFRAINHIYRLVFRYNFKMHTEKSIGL